MYTSITEAKNVRTLYASKFTSSDPAMRRILRLYLPSKNAAPGENGRKGTSKKQSIGGIRPLRSNVIRHGTQDTHSRPDFVNLQSEQARQAWPGSVQYDQIGVLVERQRSDTLFLDYDFAGTPKLRATWVDLRLWNLRSQVICDTRTRKGWHRTIRIGKRLPPFAIIAAQCCLGSDRRREALNLMRQLSLRQDGGTRFAHSRWNLLFTRKLNRRRGNK